ncbi:hypothetical protein KEM60_03211 [Austwickia sp. TVS 96-490-7B]|nr:hypothetical protein [Austwickia sp. TVS 96-490-7B]
MRMATRWVTWVGSCSSWVPYVGVEDREVRSRRRSGWWIGMFRSRCPLGSLGRLAQALPEMWETPGLLVHEWCLVGQVGESQRRRVV